MGGDWGEEFEVADHHFVGGLFAPRDGFLRVGIGLISGTIVKDGRDRDFSAFGEEEGGFEFVGALPIEVVPRDVQQGLGAASGLANFIFEGFASRVHVGH